VVNAFGWSKKKKTRLRYSLLRHTSIEVSLRSPIVLLMGAPCKEKKGSAKRKGGSRGDAFLEWRTRRPEVLGGEREGEDYKKRKTGSENGLEAFSAHKRTKSKGACTTVVPPTGEAGEVRRRPMNPEHAKGVVVSADQSRFFQEMWGGKKRGRA